MCAGCVQRTLCVQNTKKNSDFQNSQESAISEEKRKKSGTSKSLVDYKKVLYLWIIIFSRVIFVPEEIINLFSSDAHE